MLVKKLASALVCLSVTLVASDNSALLSSLKQKKIEIDKKTNELESTNLKYDWINQVIGSYSYTISDEVSGDKESGSFSVALEQPIFKSGGIYFAIKYSEANREFLQLSTKLDEQNQIKNVISTWLSIQKLDLQIKRQETLIANSKIDIMRKKEQYESGFLDSSFLDNAILSKSSLEKALIDMQSTRYEFLSSFNSLSDADYNKIAPPKFSQIGEKNFLENSLVIKQQIATSLSTDYLKKMTISNYLPTVSLTAGYHDTKIESDGVVTSDSSYKRYGLKVSMPLLDVNRGRTIEIRRLSALKQKLELADIKRSEKNEFGSISKKIEFLNKKVELATNDFKLYGSLLNSTTELYTAGEKTIYDVDTLRNSQETMKYDKLIYEIEIQQELLNLYAKMNGKI